MRVEFGWFLDRAPWSFRSGGLNTVRLGRLGFVALLQTRLGITRPEVTHLVRVNQYVARLRALDNSSAWFSTSFAVDPWSTAQDLLYARDDLVANGWDGHLPAGSSSNLLQTLAAAEAVELPLSPALADDVAGLPAALDTPLPLGISAIALQHPRSSFPAIWQAIFGKLEVRGVDIHEPDHSAAPLPSITVLQAETEWEAADHAARWLGAGGSAGINASTAVVVSHQTSILDHYLHARGLPRVGVGARSRWRAQDQIIPLFMEIIWGPANVQLLSEFLSLPVSPVRRPAGRELLKALKAEPGTGGEAWNAALEAIAELPDLDAETASELDSLFSRDLLIEQEGVSGAQIAGKAEWLAKRLNRIAHRRPELASTYAQLQTLTALISDLPLVSRTDLRRIISSVVAETTNPLAASEASDWLRLEHLTELMDPVDDVLWWGFHDATAPRTRRWDRSDVEALASVGVQLPSPESLAMLQITQSVASSRRCRNLLVVQTAQQEGEPTENNPLLEALVAAQPATDPGRSLRDQIKERTITPAQLVEDNVWALAGRSAQVAPVDRVPVAPPPLEFELEPRADFTPDALSFSQLGNLLGCSLAWVLDKKMRLRPADADSAPSGNTMIGIFAHKLVEELHHDLSAQLRAVPTPEEIDRKIDDLLPHLASELLLPGQSARLKNLRAVLSSNVMKFFTWVSAAGITIQDVEKPFEKTLELTVDGKQVAVPVRGSIDVAGIDGEGRPAVIDLKWSNRDKYRLEEVREGKALQLALYQWALAEDVGEYVGEGGPAGENGPAAYYLLKQGTFASTHSGLGGSATAAEGPDALWDTAVKAATFSVSEVVHGRITATPLVDTAREAAGGETGEARATADGRFYGKPPCRFCHFSRLCGLAGDFS